MVRTSAFIDQLTKEFSIMIIETKGYSCRKCQSEGLVKMTQMRPVARNITVKPVVPRAYLRPKNARRKICAGLNGCLGSRAFRSKDKVWLWSALNRETREIVASACGERSENTCRILWDRVPSTYKEAIVFSAYWGAYQAVTPSEQHCPVGKETGETAHSERWNNTLWKQLARFVRR